MRSLQLRPAAAAYLPVTGRTQPDRAAAAHCCAVQLFWRMPRGPRTSHGNASAFPARSVRLRASGLAPGRSAAGCGAAPTRRESIRTIHAALDRGITLIDTAPVYGFGRSEEIVGKALAEGGRRSRPLSPPKSGSIGRTSKRVPQRAAARASVKEIDDSLRRLRTD